MSEAQRQKHKSETTDLKLRHKAEFWSTKKKAVEDFNATEEFNGYGLQ